MKPHYLITGFLALAFCVTGHFFMAAYTDFCITQSRLELLKGQERSVKHQITEYQEKLNQLEQVNAFVRQANELGLKKDQWDIFFVDLKDEPMSFSKLGVILSQTRNSGHYFFKPGTLSIKTGASLPDASTAQNSSNSDSQPDKTTRLPQSVQPVSPAAPPSEADVTVSMDGRFLVRRQGSG